MLLAVAAPQVSLTVVKACLWQQHQQGMKAAQTASSTAATTQQLSASLAAMQITREGPPASGAAEARKLVVHECHNVAQQPRQS